MATEESHIPRSIIPAFRLSDLAEEFREHSRGELEHLQQSEPSFEESLSQQAVALVLRKLAQRDGRGEP